MIAVDTNVLVRVVTGDDPEQSRRARELFSGEELWLAKTVCLELEWVLRYTYELDRTAMTKVFTTMLGYPRIEIEDRSALIRAIVWYERGLDFADALHLASSRAADQFATFDQRLARRATGLEPPVKQLS